MSDIKELYDYCVYTMYDTMSRSLLESTGSAARYHVRDDVYTSVLDIMRRIEENTVSNAIYEYEY